MWINRSYLPVKFNTAIMLPRALLSPRPDRNGCYAKLWAEGLSTLIKGVTFKQLVNGCVRPNDTFLWGKSLKWQLCRAFFHWIVNASPTVSVVKKTSREVQNCEKNESRESSYCEKNAPWETKLWKLLQNTMKHVTKSKNTKNMIIVYNHFIKHSFYCFLLQKNLSITKFVSLLDNFLA